MICVYRWFDQWKERNQIHFSFGEWGVAPHVVKANYSNNNNDNNNNNNDDNEEKDTETTLSNKPHQFSFCRWRQPLLSVPSPYSHRVQFLQMQSSTTTSSKVSSSSYGFYFPPSIVDNQSSEAQHWLCVYPK